ncbi:hypothetical protein PIN31115_04517 [Pandoraea iniqua]|uniref:Uncharacterized protein n=1 Tax=Pandoraea iniqua TaxID=2508288 RepID=A0A5E4YHY3_9BURK|nr:hypothetical protein [Pandoraea iniqua]VVE48361.1 hypothetical protein PIN31115_04517 [Pandoraea iniqua]
MTDATCKTNTNTTTSVLSRDDVQLLTEIGFVGIGRKDPARAATLFRALCVLRPQSPFPYTGLAIALMSGGRPGEAAALLQAFDTAMPGDVAVQTYLGLALSLSGHGGKANTVLKNVVRSSKATEPEKGLARALLAQGICAVH